MERALLTEASVAEAVAADGVVDAGHRAAEGRDAVAAVDDAVARFTQRRAVGRAAIDKGVAVAVIDKGVADDAAVGARLAAAVDAGVGGGAAEAIAVAAGIAGVGVRAASKGWTGGGVITRCRAEGLAGDVETFAPLRTDERVTAGLIEARLGQQRTRQLGGEVSTVAPQHSVDGVDAGGRRCHVDRAGEVRTLGDTVLDAHTVEADRLVLAEGEQRLIAGGFVAVAVAGVTGGGDDDEGHQ